jgi:hypothetical protein
MLSDGRLLYSTADASRRVGLGDNALMGLNSFNGITVDATTAFLKYTWGGDTDLDEDVDVADLGALASAWQSSGSWRNGDFDYNGTIDVNDLGLLASNWQAGVVASGGPSLADALASLGLPVTLPEPGAAMVCITIASVTLRRRCQSPCSGLD